MSQIKQNDTGAGATVCPVCADILDGMSFQSEAPGTVGREDTPVFHHLGLRRQRDELCWWGPGEYFIAFV